MTIGFVLLSLGAIAVVAALTSALVGVALAAASGWLRRLAPAAESRLLLAAAITPAFVTALAFGAAMAPSLGFAADHCAMHGAHHPHLCLLHHDGAWPAAAVVVLAIAFAMRIGAATIRAMVGIIRSQSTCRALATASAKESGLRVLPVDDLQAFVIGVFRPQVYVSRGLLSAGEGTLAPVLAHERAHVHRRDPLRRLVASMSLAFHLPGIAWWLERRLACSQELAADADAAEVTGDAARVAEALLRLARLRVKQPATAIAFAASSLEARVRSLLALGPRRRGPGPWMLVSLAGLLVVFFGASADPIHHGIETLLGLVAH